MKTLIKGRCIDALTRVHGWGVRNPTRWGNGWRHRVLVVAGRWSRLMTAEACCSERPPHHLPQTKAGENTQEYRTYQLTPKPTKIPFIPQRLLIYSVKYKNWSFLPSAAGRTSPIPRTVAGNHRNGIGNCLHGRQTLRKCISLRPFSF